MPVTKLDRMESSIAGLAVSGFARADDISGLDL
jgi:hypothetical protein